MSRYRAIMLAVALLVASRVQAQTAAAAGATPARPTRHLTALRATGKVVVDGHLDESDWGRALVAKDFLQRDPDEGKPATEPTEVRILYDDEAIYVGARMFDSEPSKIARRLTRRDGNTDGIVDRIVVAFDTHRDRLNAAIFSVTAAGSIGDSIMYNDSSEDSTWDGVWDAAVAIDDKGWTAEMRIPFSQLRFAAAERMVWGMHAVRYVQRKNEESWWAFVPKKESGLISRAGELDGLDGITSRPHLELLPYATARSEISGTAQPGDPFNDGRTGVATVGLDAKWGFASNMTMDATVNPDFGQVEVDPAVVNLTVFETFYQEKRPFFIEGAEAFSNFGQHGGTSHMGFNRANPSLFYSRRIGRTPQGAAAGEYVDRPTATTIIGAAKVTGKTSRGWTVNFIDAATAREWANTSTEGVTGRSEVEPFTNYLAGRVRRDLGQRAGFGFLTTAVNRDQSDAALAAQLPGSAFVVGGDGHLFLTSKRDYVISGSFSGSRVGGSSSSIARLQRSSARYFQRPDATHVAYDTTRESLSGWNLQTDFNRNNGNVRPNVSFWAVSPGFEVNDAGYMTNADRFGGHAAVQLFKLTPDGFSRTRWLLLSKWNVWNFARDPIADGVYAGFGATLRNYWSMKVDAVGGRWTFDDRLTRGGPIMRSPSFLSTSLELEGDERKALVWSVQGGYATQPDGSWSWKGEVGLKVKPLPTLSLEVAPTFTHLVTDVQYVRTVNDLSAVEMFGSRYVFAALTQKELGIETRFNLILNPRMSLQLYLQPLVSAGRYSGFKEAARPRTYDFLRYGQDTGTITYDAASGAYTVHPGPGGTGTPFAIPNPDFNFASLRSNTVFRWEFRPGSTLYVVWTQQREDETTDGRFAFNQDMTRMMRAPGDNVFMVKVSYWFAR